jgi:hypothetical protein
MSGPLTGVSSNNGQAAGNQQQFGILLQLLKRIADSLAPLYQAGNWTPTLVGLTTPGAPVFTSLAGSYEKIGRQVTARFSMVTSSLGGMTGTVTVGGLPFTPTTAANDDGTLSLGIWSGISLSAGYTQLAGYVNAGNDYAGLVMTGSGVAAGNLQASALAAATQLVGVISYRTN